MTKTCGNCVNCYKDGQSWSCEEYGYYYAGCPVDCSPPADDPCPLWTDDPERKNTWMRYV